MQSIRERIRSLELSSGGADETAQLISVSAAVGKSESTTSESGGSEGIVAKAKRLLSEDRNEEEGRVDGVRKKFEKKEEGVVGATEGVKEVKRRLEMLEKMDEETARVGKVVRKLDDKASTEEGGDLIREEAEEKSQENGTVGKVKVASVFQEEGVLVNQKGGARIIKKDERSKELEKKVGIVQKLKMFEGDGVGTDQEAKGTRDHMEIHTTKIPRAPFGAPRETASPIKSAIGTVQCTEERNIREDLAALKKVNTELISCLVRLTAAFEEVETQRDDLAKRLRTLESKL